MFSVGWDKKSYKICKTRVSLNYCLAKILQIFCLQFCKPLAYLQMKNMKLWNAFGNSGGYSRTATVSHVTIHMVGQSTTTVVNW